MNQSALSDKETKNKWSKLKDRDLDEIIYTEKIQPDKIKYLKTRRHSENQDFFVLYGNENINKIECEERNGCYGYGGKIQPDNFLITKDSVGMLKLPTFNKSRGDKIIITRNSRSFLNFYEPYIEGGYVYIPVKYDVMSGATKGIMTTLTAISGYSLEDVKGWIKIARFGTQSQKEENPIQIE